MQLVEFRYVLMLLESTKHSIFAYENWKFDENASHEVMKLEEPYNRLCKSSLYHLQHFVSRNIWHETISNLNQFEKNGIQIGGERIEISSHEYDVEKNKLKIKTWKLHLSMPFYLRK